MKLRAWRLVRSLYQNDAFSGEGAARFGGRWNSIGGRVVYTADSRALATLEVLVTAASAFRADAFAVIGATFNEHLVTQVDPDALPVGWDAPDRHPATATIGDAGLTTGESPVLRVPSVVVTGEHNYLINPLHPAYSEIRVTSPQPFRFDPRLRYGLDS